MILQTTPDYLAAWVLLFIISIVVYAGKCSATGDYVKDDGIKTIFSASVCLVATIWAVRHLFF